MVKQLCFINQGKVLALDSVALKLLYSQFDLNYFSRLPHVGQGKIFNRALGEKLAIVLLLDETIC